MWHGNRALVYERSWSYFICIRSQLYVPFPLCIRILCIRGCLHLYVQDVIAHEADILKFLGQLVT